MKTSKCKGCGLPILWRYTPSMRMMPLNPEPVREVVTGTYVIESAEDCRPAHPLFDAGKAFYLNHWATCAKAEDFKS